MRGDPGDAAARTLRRPKWRRLPMNPLVAVEEKASEYPQKNHWKTVTALLADTAHIKVTGRGLESDLGIHSDGTYEHFSVERDQNIGRLRWR